MDALITEMINTLSQARQAVEQEMNGLGPTRPADRARLAHLRTSAGDFLRQARSLLELMADSDADADLMYGVEDLAEFFGDTEAQIALRLKAGHDL